MSTPLVNSDPICASSERPLNHVGSSRRCAIIQGVSCVAALSAAVATANGVLAILNDTARQDAAPAVLPASWGLLIWPAAELVLLALCVAEACKPRGLLRRLVGAWLPLANLFLIVWLCLMATTPLMLEVRLIVVAVLVFLQLLIALGMWRSSRGIPQASSPWENILFSGGFSLFFGVCAATFVVISISSLRALGYLRRLNVGKDGGTWHFWEDELVMTFCLLWLCAVVCLIGQWCLQDGVVGLAFVWLFAAIADRQRDVMAHEMCVAGQGPVSCHGLLLYGAEAAAWVVGLSSSILLLLQLRHFVRDTNRIDRQLQAHCSRSSC